MPFKFDFALDDIDDSLDPTSTASTSAKSEQNHAPNSAHLTSDALKDTLIPCSEIPLKELLASLPSRISYSPLSIQLSGSSGSQSKPDEELVSATQNATPNLPPSSEFVLARRDLFDARFHLISSGSKDEDPALQFIDAPSDLVPRVYEGGLKTWECALDLVSYLDEIGSGCNLRGKRVLEIGCGTAVPSLYLLNKLFSLEAPQVPSSSSDLVEPRTSIHVQDYNRSVIELVTVPNIVLAWYFSPASLSYRSRPRHNGQRTGTSSQDVTEFDSESESDEPSADPSTAAELFLSSSLKTAFMQTLASQHIDIRFFVGSWGTFYSDGMPYDVVLSSETIYRMDSLPSLIQLLTNSCPASSGSLDLEGDKSTYGCFSFPLCLVAAKLIYFGVGGGVEDFVRAVQSRGGMVSTVWEKREGVGRRVMKVSM